MTFASDAQIRAEVLAWVDENWRPEEPLLDWRRRLVDARLACPSWPERWGGRAMTAVQEAVVTAALVEAGVPGVPDSVGMHLAAPTLLAHGGDEIRDRLLVPTVTGEMVWCQLFSEPGSGSDLASLSMRAERDGDLWRLTGQKLWTTGARQADYGLALARTDPSAPKHRGITCFAVPMRQSGLDVRPLRQMNGHSSFNEVFFDDARVDQCDVIGDLNDGWTVALTTLAHERRLARHLRTSAMRDGGGRVWREARAERTAASEPHKWYPQRAGRVDLLIERAHERAVAGDSLVRQAVVRSWSLSRTATLSAQRAAAARVAGRGPGAEGSLGKLSSSAIARSAAATHSLISGPEALLSGPDSPHQGIIAEILVSVPGQSIAGGTDEIQHNIIGERILGLAREPSLDNNIAFSEIPRST